MNYWDIDPALADLLALHLPEDVLAFITPHLRKLGGVAGDRLDELAMIADKERNKPVLRTRSRFGVDEDWVDYHPSYREMEKIGYSDFGIHAMSRTEGVLGWPERYLPLAKYAFQYLFVQAEFGLMCPISVTDSSTYLIERYGNEELKRRFLPGMTSTDPAKLLKGTQFMTERGGGSDIGTNRLKAVQEDGHWRLYGDKWFCSAVDADVVLLLARPEGAAGGTKGLALYAMPRRLDDGSRNTYRIGRLKDKMGTRSMPSGEVLFDGAVAYLVGDVNRGLKQMLDQVNLSRLSHGVRAAAMMRRCWNEAMVVSNFRVAFKHRLIDLPLHRRQMMKLLLPTEQALSIFTYSAQVMQRADDGDAQAKSELRMLTPLFKFRACRDNVKVATGSMEVRGGNGYIEDFVNEKLVRDSHIGVLWEGTSSVNALDAVQRAAGKDGAHNAVAESMKAWLSASQGIPEAFSNQLAQEIEDARKFMGESVGTPEGEANSREAASRMYHAISAVLLAGEGARIGSKGGDARRLLISRQVLMHRLGIGKRDSKKELEIEALLLNNNPVSLALAQELVS
ncbi:acyl-CoA dehydrogenase family protein [Alcaligenaceae bacterium]|nr:acyl-CoA dehydrogenase family protein [Alcaligenaceae bacterium]